MTPAQKTAFIKTVKAYYKKSGRHDLPWRLTIDPYKVAVSEIMLQQTQVARVKEKYKEFLKVFPTVRSLANAPLQQVLLLWSGLGYNRRAKFLHQMAQNIMTEYSGTVPKNFEELLKLPGIGHYTAGAISAFAYNQPVPIIETNIRSVYLHHFFNDNRPSSAPPSSRATAGEAKISDKELMNLIIETLDDKNPREWYWALMDYGSFLKQSGVKIHRNSKHHVKQTAFKGSLREVRGGIIKTLTQKNATTLELQKILSFDRERIDEALTNLIQEQFIVKKGQRYFL